MTSSISLWDEEARSVPVIEHYAEVLATSHMRTHLSLSIISSPLDVSNSPLGRGKLIVQSKSRLDLEEGDVRLGYRIMWVSLSTRSRTHSY